MNTSSIFSIFIFTTRLTQKYIEIYKKTHLHVSYEI